MHTCPVCLLGQHKSKGVVLTSKDCTRLWTSLNPDLTEGGSGFVWDVLGPFIRCRSDRSESDGVTVLDPLK